MLKFLPSIVFSLAVVFSFAASVLAQSQVVNLSAGNSLTVNCPTKLSAEFHSASKQVQIVCAALATVLPTVTPTSTISHDPTKWHSPTDHEHGDAPPQWVTDFNMTNFGRGLVYGGDENSGPMENSMKHAGYKGVALAGISDGQLVQVYYRFHAASNPMDRAARYHSFEMYAKDINGGVSFWQGWYDVNDPNVPFARISTIDDGIVLEVRPVLIGVDQRALDAMVNIDEFWYTSAPGLDIQLRMRASTLMMPNELATNMDQSTWVPTNSRSTVPEASMFQPGLMRGIFINWYTPLDRRDIRGWYCATALGALVDCSATGALKQYRAPTFPSGFQASQEGRIFVCPNCRIPN